MRIHFHYVQLQFLELSSLQAALPNGQMPASFVGGVTQPWFPEDPVASFVAGGPQGKFYLILNRMS